VSTRTLMTVADFERLPDDGNRHELDERELIVMPPPMYRHGRIQARVARLLGNFVDDRALGEVATKCGFRLSDETVLGPDVVFNRRERLALIEFDHYSRFAPDLVVEVVSPSVNARQFNRKIGQYLKSGTHTIWVLDPDSETVNVYRREGAFRMLGPDDTIDAPELLPGFSASVRSLFE
jgi:Uma2 family endonuclease